MPLDWTEITPREHVSSDVVTGEVLHRVHISAGNAASGLCEAYADVSVPTVARHGYLSTYVTLVFAKAAVQTEVDA